MRAGPGDGVMLMMRMMGMMGMMGMMRMMRMMRMLMMITSWTFSFVWSDSSPAPVRQAPV